MRLKHRRNALVATTIALLLGVHILASDGANIVDTSPSKLKPRIEPRRTFPGIRVGADLKNDRQLVVKFREGSGVEASGGSWTSDAAKRDNSRLDRPVGKFVSIDESIKRANGAVEKYAGARVLPLMTATDSEVSELRESAEAASGQEMADMSLYSSILLDKPNPTAINALMRTLSRNPLIEQVYPQSMPRDADIPPPTSIDLRGSQGYLNPAPTGIDVPYARRFQGGKGARVSIIDVESGWRVEHEDLPGPSAIFSWHGTNGGGEHGTAVAGMLWGLDNSYGVTGITPHSRMGWSSVTFSQFPNFFFSPASAIVNAAADLSAGDIILIEQHAPLLFDGVAYPDNSCNPRDIGYLPVEIFGAEFDAISQATARGIIVVEAAGNGTMNLDGYPEFNRTIRDSGAIIVGASVGGGSNSPACFTNHGSRVDVFSWGGSVATLGYGESSSLRADGGDARQWYTRTFSGTSSASPVVTGAAALVQSIRLSHGLPRLTARQMRSLLVGTGTPQGSGVRIGTQPDLRSALRATMPDRGLMRITGIPTASPAATGFVGTVRVRNDGGQSWASGTHSAQCSWEAGGPVVATGSFVGIVDHGDSAQMGLTGLTPASEGIHTLTCNFIAGGVVVATQSESMIITESGKYDGEVVSFVLPRTMAYGNRGDNARPYLADVTVKNTGTKVWDASSSSPVELQTSPDGNAFLVSGLVPPGSQVTVPVTVTCQNAGPNEFSIHLKLGGVPFGSSKSATSRCLGSDNKPDDG
ncbi:S8 family serine peptidase [Streptomyces sp. NPDC055078]